MVFAVGSPTPLQKQVCCLFLWSSQAEFHAWTSSATWRSGAGNLLTKVGTNAHTWSPRSAWESDTGIQAHSQKPVPMCPTRLQAVSAVWNSEGRGLLLPLGCPCLISNHCLEIRFKQPGPLAKAGAGACPWTPSSILPLGVQAARPTCKSKHCHACLNSKVQLQNSKVQLQNLGGGGGCWHLLLLAGCLSLTSSHHLEFMWLK